MLNCKHVYIQLKYSYMVIYTFCGGIVKDCEARYLKLLKFGVLCYMYINILLIVCYLQVSWN